MRKKMKNKNKKKFKYKVSVVIPCYKVEKYIKRCLDSILKQSLDDLEIICVNDVHQITP